MSDALPRPSTAGPTSAPSAVVLLRVDASPRIGVGHAMRLLALAQELRTRGVAVHLAGDLEIDWVAGAYDAAAVTPHPRPAGPEECVALARALGASHCVLDRYDLDAEWGTQLRAAGIAVMTMVDGTFSAHQDADLYVDQNPGAQPRHDQPGRIALAGASYTLFRDDMLALRRPLEDSDARVDAPDPGLASGPLRLLCVFGGTDPLGAAPVVTPLAVEVARLLGRGVDVTVVTSDPTWVEHLQAGLPPGCAVRASGPLSDLARRARDCDLVITASGSSVWELMCLGVPLAVVCVVDNQRPGYAMVVTNELAAGIGDLAALREDDAARRVAIDTLAATLGDPPVRRRRAERAQAMLDGRGRERVADALLALRAAADDIDTPSNGSSGPTSTAPGSPPDVPPDATTLRPGTA